jgi:maleate isomerase
VTTHRVGLVVPSSNTTMEAEIPELLRRQGSATGAEFTVHSSRVRMRQVTPEELARMNAASDRCAEELADACCDVLAYACLVAVMVDGAGAHTTAERRLERAAAGQGWELPVVTSAGALLTGLSVLMARRIALLAPYAPALTAKVVAYLEAHGIAVTDAVSLDVTDNVAVGRLDPHQLVSLADRLDVSEVDAVVLSACVQMPSLPVVSTVEQRLGRPVLTAATATTYALLDRLGLRPQISGAGSLLAGAR